MFPSSQVKSQAARAVLQVIMTVYRLCEFVGRIEIRDHAQEKRKGKVRRNRPETTGTHKTEGKTANV